uniref:Uncharacterized protein n=2 Tax=Panagrolaimus sp. JU765 TaxID=591449 RepID=A0AC34QLJ5_9BILA
MFESLKNVYLNGKPMTTLVENHNSNVEPGSSSGSSDPSLPTSASNENILNTSDSTSSLCSDTTSVKCPLKRSSSSVSNTTEYKSLPRFTATAPEGSVLTPSPRIPTSPVCSDFTAPKFPKAVSLIKQNEFGGFEIQILFFA